MPDNFEYWRKRCLDRLDSAETSLEYPFKDIANMLDHAYLDKKPMGLAIQKIIEGFGDLRDSIKEVKVIKEKP